VTKQYNMISVVHNPYGSKELETTLVKDAVMHESSSNSTNTLPFKRALQFWYYKK